VFADADNSYHAWYPAQPKSIILSSSTLTYIGAYGSSGTTTIRIANYFHKAKIQRFYVKTDAGTAHVAFGTGSATTTDVNGSSSGVSSGELSTNNTFSMRQDIFIEVGRTTGTPNVITVTADTEQQSDN
jgi:hypothetical protein